MQNHIFAITLAATGLIGSASWAECGKLCDSGWLKSATLTEVQAEVDGGADVNAQSKNGLTPFASSAKGRNIQGPIKRWGRY